MGDHVTSDIVPVATRTFFRVIAMEVELQEGEIFLDDDDVDDSREMLDGSTRVMLESFQTMTIQNKYFDYNSSVIKNQQEVINYGFTSSNDNLTDAKIISCLEDTNDNLNEAKIISCLEDILNTSATNDELKTAITEIFQQILSVSVYHRQFTTEIAVPYLIKCLSSKPHSYREKCLCSLACLADDDKYYRDFMLDHEILTAILPLAISRAPEDMVSIVENVSYLLYYLCQEKHGYPELKKVSPIYPIATKMLQFFSRRQILINGCKILTCLAAANPNDKAITEHPCDRLFFLLCHKSRKIVILALTLLRHITISKNKLKHLIKFLPLLFSMRDHEIFVISCQIISKVTEESRQKTFLHRIILMNFYIKLIKIINKKEKETLIHALRAIATGIIFGKPNFIKYILTTDIIRCLCNILVHEKSDAVILILSLECINKFITGEELKAKKNKSTVRRLQQCNGIEVIREIESKFSLDANVRSTATEILRKYTAIATTMATTVEAAAVEANA